MHYRHRNVITGNKIKTSNIYTYFTIPILAYTIKSLMHRSEIEPAGSSRRKTSETLTLYLETYLDKYFYTSCGGGRSEDRSRDHKGSLSSAPANGSWNGSTISVWYQNKISELLTRRSVNSCKRHSCWRVLTWRGGGLVGGNIISSFGGESKNLQTIVACLQCFTDAWRLIWSGS